MQIIEALKENREQWDADNKTALEIVMAEAKAARETRKGKPVAARSWQYANSNFGMGL